MTRDRRVAVIGLGYVGLPFAIAFSEAGLDVLGVDLSADRVARRSTHVIRRSTTSPTNASAPRSTGRCRVVTQADATLDDTDAIFVCVPTPITATKDPDLGPVLAAAGFIRDHVRAGQLIVLQSTTFPGTTTWTVSRGHRGRAACAPARTSTSPTRPNASTRAIRPAPRAIVPRLVGGTHARSDRAGGRRCSRQINDHVVELSSPDAAELAKLLENVFRNVNIAFVNQLALLCERMGLDVWEIIDAAATKPFGFMRFTPGPGVGGHCIPVDPYYLSWRAREFDFVDRFIELAGDINLAMPRHVVDLVAEALNDRGRALKGAKVGVVGVAFKPDVQDDRNSPAADVIAGLAERGADVRFHDPHVTTFRASDGTQRTGAAGGPARLGGRRRRRHRAPGHRLGRRSTRRPAWSSTRSTARAGTPVGDRQVLRLGAGWSTAREAGRPA